MTTIPGTVDGGAHGAIRRDRVGRRARDRTRGGRWILLAVPGLLFVLIVFIYPLAGMLMRSFTEPSVGLGNYARFVDSPLTWGSLSQTLRMSVIVTIVSAVVGYAYAYLMATVSTRWALILLGAVLIPTFVSFLVRIFAMQIMLRDTGVVNSILVGLGIIRQPLGLIRNDFAVTFGMTAFLLPLFILTAYAVMRRIDPDYVRAAAVLGASPFRSFLRVYFPLSLPGVAAGSLLVFVFALGYYITPAVLGDGRRLYLPELVAFYRTRLDWGFASTISVVLLFVVLATLILAARVVKIRDVFGVQIEQ